MITKPNGNLLGSNKVTQLIMGQEMAHSESSIFNYIPSLFWQYYDLSAFNLEKKLGKQSRVSTSLTKVSSQHLWISRAQNT